MKALLEALDWIVSFFLMMALMGLFLICVVLYTIPTLILIGGSYAYLSLSDRRQRK